MNDAIGPLVKTKLFVPHSRWELIQRPRLIMRLNDGLKSTLTLVSASAGCGKTTVLSEWARQIQLPVAWLTLDESDNDLTRYLLYLVSALQTIFPGIGETVKGTLRSPQLPPVEPLLAVLINEITEGTNNAFLLILDDYHVIKTQSIHQAMTFLIDHIPPQLHLVIATRADPPLPLARLRGRGQLTELRAADLSFMPDEAAAFFNQTMGLQLPEDHIAALEARTEGWIVGLQLAALSMKGRKDSGEFIAALSGSHHYILDYLMEEVLRGQPEAVQTFLLRTCVLDALCGSLCDAVLFEEGAGATGKDNQPSHAILAYLEQNNLFIVSLDDSRGWYRYHHLFADLLRSLINRFDVGQIAEIDLRASRWYEHHDMITEAIHHALRAGDRERAAELIERNSMRMLMDGEMMTVLTWLTALPEELVCSRPWLSVYHAWVLVLTSKLDDIERRLAEAARSLASFPASDRHILGHMAAIRAYAASKRNDPLQAIALSHEALQNLAPDDQPLRGLISFILGMASLVKGDLLRACPALEEAGRLSRLSGSLHMAIPAYCALGAQELILGQLHKSEETFLAALRLAMTASIAVKPGRKVSPLAMRAFCELSKLHYEWNHLTEALQYAHDSVELGQKWGNPEANVRAYTVLAQVLQTQGNLEEAKDALQHAVQTVHRHNLSSWSAGEVNDCQIRLWLDPLKGNPSAAARWAEAHDSILQKDSELPYIQEIEHIALARVLLALGRYEDALVLLNRLNIQTETGRRVSRVIQILVLKAVALSASGEQENAILTLEKALSLGEPEGFTRTFLDEGAPVAGLLKKIVAVRHPPSLAYIRRLLSCFGIEQDDQGSSECGLIESLSERELEVLRLMAAGHSNGEIAQKLVIAISTVKRHINHIFGKLGVTTRVQAMVKAREFRLI